MYFDSASSTAASVGARRSGAGFVGHHHDSSTAAPSVGIINNNGTGSNLVDETRCSCCPFGYHIDLDFVEFASRATSPCSMMSDRDSLSLLNNTTNRSLNLSSTATTSEKFVDSANQSSSVANENLEEKYYKNLLAGECREEKSTKHGTSNNNGNEDVEYGVIMKQFSNKNNNNNETTFMSDSFESLVMDFNDALARSSSMSNYATNRNCSIGGKNCSTAMMTTDNDESSHDSSFNLRDNQYGVIGGYSARIVRIWI